MTIYNIVSSYIESSPAVCEGHKMIDENSMSILSDYCSVLDEIFDSCLGSSITVDLVDDDMVSIQMVLAAFSANRFNQQYFDLIERAVSFTVSNTKNAELDIKFVFPSVFKQ